MDEDVQKTGGQADLGGNNDVTDKFDVFRIAGNNAARSSRFIFNVKRLERQQERTLFFCLVFIEFSQHFREVDLCRSSQVLLLSFPITTLQDISQHKNAAFEDDTRALCIIIDHSKR